MAAFTSESVSVRYGKRAQNPSVTALALSAMATRKPCYGATAGASNGSVGQLVALS
jgi:hypothetical protein